MAGSKDGSSYQIELVRSSAVDVLPSPVVNMATALEIPSSFEDWDQERFRVFVVVTCKQNW